MGKQKISKIIKTIRQLKPRLLLTLAFTPAAITFGTSCSAAQSTTQIAPASKDTISPQMRFLAAGIANMRQQLQCAEARFTYYHATPRQPTPDWVLKELAKQGMKIRPPGPGPLLKETTVVRWYYQKPQLAIWVEETNNDQEELVSRQRLVFDGKQVSLLGGPLQKQDQHETQSKVEQGEGGKEGNIDLKKFSHLPDGTVLPPENALRDGLWHFMPQADLRFHTYEGPIQLDKVLLQKQWNPVFKGEETVFGSQCWKVEVSSEKGVGDYWIDVEHGFLVRKVERNRYVDGKLVLIARMEAPKLLESNGVWVPALAETRAFEQPVNSATATSYIAERLIISNFKANGNLPASIFTMDWPVGARVQDNFTGKRFTVGGLGSPQPAPVPQPIEAKPKQSAAAPSIAPQEKLKP